MAKLETRGLCKGWDFPLLDQLDLSVEEGEFFVVVGPSGAGKTTLLRLIAGLESADAGRIFIGAREVTRIPPYHRRAAMTFESYALYPHLSVFENIASPLRARGERDPSVRRRVTAIAELLQIERLLERKPDEVSGGQKQRAALGRTLAADPEVFLLDEPLSHLDARIRHDLRRQFHTLEALRKTATLYVTHDYTEALSLGDRIAVIGGGGFLQVGSARDIYENPVSVEVARHLGQLEINVHDAELVAQGGQLQARVAGAGDLSFPVAEQRARQLTTASTSAEREVSLAVRPQHIALAGPDAGGVPGVAESFQAFGATGALTVTVGGATFRVLTSPDLDFREGMPVRLAFDTAHFLYFARDGGRNLARGESGDN